MKLGKLRKLQIKISLSSELFFFLTQCVCIRIRNVFVCYVSMLVAMKLYVSKATYLQLRNFHPGKFILWLSWLRGNVVF
jgi:hypothetical protein